MHVDGVTVLAAFVCPEYQMLDAQAKHVPDAMQTVDVAVDVASILHAELKLPFTVQGTQRMLRLSARWLSV